MMKNDKEFENLFKSNYTRLYYYALTFVDDAEVCKDIVSDVFETLWHDYDSVRPDGRMAYLYACVKNRCVDHLRRRSVKQRYVLFYATDVREGLLGTDRELEERLQRQGHQRDAATTALRPGTVLLPQEVLPGGGCHPGHHHGRRQTAHHHGAEKPERRIYVKVST